MKELIRYRKIATIIKSCNTEDQLAEARRWVFRLKLDFETKWDLVDLIQKSELELLTKRLHLIKTGGNKGFSLIELIVSVGIMSIIALGSVQLLQNSMLQAASIQVKSSENSLTGSLSQIAMNNDACTNAITQTAQQFGGQIRFDLPDGTTITQLNDVINYPLNVADFSIIGAQLINTGYDGTKVYFGSMSLSLSSTKKILGPKYFAARTLASVYVSVNKDGYIAGCGPTPPILQMVPTPAPTPTPPAYDPQFVRGCLDIGGSYNDGTCTITHNGQHD